MNAMASRFSQVRIDGELQKLEKTASGRLKQLCDVWDSLGLDDEAVTERFASLHEHHSSLFEEMVREECDLRDKMQQKIDALLQHLNMVNIDLDMSASCNIEGLGVIPARAKLETCLHDLRIKHKEHQDRRNQLEKQERALCKHIGEVVHPRPEQKALSTETLNLLQKRVHSLKAKEDKLLQAFYELRNAIIQLYADVEEQPKNYFEQDVASGEVDKISLAPENIEKIKELKASLETRLEQLEQETRSKRERVSQLWERLEIDIIDRESFLDANSGSSRRVREALDDEIQRLEELKHLNIERFVLRMREELEELWNKCCVSEEERAAFAPFTSQEFCDELLEAHEVEVRRLETFYSDNHEIFELLKRRKDLWDRMQQLESLSHAPDRYSNRGGQLLKEEKERKQLTKSLPQVEADLKRRIKSWEQSTGEPFMLNGRRATTLLEEEWEGRQQAKDREKHERKVAQQKQLERDAFGTTLNSAMKRKLASATPDTKSKQMRFTAAQPSVSKVGATPQGRADMTAARRAAPAAAARRLLPARSNAQNRTGSTRLNFNFPVVSNININVVGQNAAANANDTLASTISYTDFSHHLEARATRSSAAPNVLLQGAGRAALSSVNTPLNPKSQVKVAQSAPAKPPRQLRSTPKTPSATIIKNTPKTAPKFTRTRNNLPILF